MLSSPARRELQRGDRGPRAGGAAPPRGETIPGHSFEQTKPGTSGASGRESRDVTKWQGARVPGPLQVSRTPQSPARTPSGQQKILFAFSAEPLLPPQNPNLELGENSALLPNVLQPSRAEPFPQPLH